MNSLKLPPGSAAIARSGVSKKGYSSVMAESLFGGAAAAKTRRETALADWVVYALILVVGGIQFICYPHFTDFVSDPQYPDLARSILDQHSYQFDYLPETTLPPGFPLILALVGRFWGLGPAVPFRVIAVSTTLGLIFAYQLLRRVGGRGLAAAATLLLGSSPVLFGFCTFIIFADMPYLLASMLALWLAVKIDRSEPERVPTVWVLLFGVAVVMAVLTRSVGIALLAGLGAWVVTSLLLAPETGRRRLKRFLLPLVLGVAAQLAWSVWAQRHQFLEWQLPGYPESYAAQLRVKNGQYPELGLATFGDIPSRVERNILTRAAGFGQLLARRYVSPFWSSPFIVGVLLLVGIGLASSFRTGGELHDWYFLGYEGIFVLWPWDYDNRFLFPVVPLACLYLWRGVKALKDPAIRRPKAIGLCFLLGGSILGLASVTFAVRLMSFTGGADHPRGDRLQPIAAAFFWGMLAVLGFVMFRFSPPRESPGGIPPSPWPRLIAKLETSLSLRFVAILILAVVVGSGIARQLAMGRGNMKPDIKHMRAHWEIEAANWIRTHEPSDQVIMARNVDIFFHYTGRRVVWFPPISNPNILMNGIRRFNVGVLVVMKDPWHYWLPTEDVCFQSLARAYESALHLSYQDPNFQVYEVILPSHVTSHASRQ
jgi:hypothetical protein